MDRRWIVSGCFLVLLASGASTSLSANPGPGRIPRPFSQLLYGDLQEREILRQALELEVRDCMQRKGFSYTIPTKPLGPDPHENPYGFIAPGDAAARGYGFSETPAAAPDEPNESYAALHNDEAKEAWREALIGSPERAIPVAHVVTDTISADTRSCIFRARIATYGDPKWDEIEFPLDELANGVVRRTIGSEEFAGSRREWQRCMKQNGFDLAAELGAAPKAARKRGDAAFERAIATADARCLLETDSWTIARRVQERLEKLERERAPARFERVSALHARAVARAQRRVGAAAGP